MSSIPDHCTWPLAFSTPYYSVPKLHAQGIRYAALQEDLDTSMAEAESNAERLASAQQLIRQYETRIRQYDQDLDSVAEDLEVMHGRAQAAEKQVKKRHGYVCVGGGYVCVGGIYMVWNKICGPACDS